jgi:hypothetical protein
MIFDSFKSESNEKYCVSQVIITSTKDLAGINLKIIFKESTSLIIYKPSTRMSKVAMIYIHK